MGKKIKTFAKVLIILGMIAFGVLAYISFKNYYADRPFTVYADGYKEYGDNPYIPSSSVERGFRAYAELTETIYYVCGFFGCLLGGLPLYWFGCLFQRVEWMHMDIEALKKQQTAKPN